MSHTSGGIWIHDADEATFESTEIRCVKFIVPSAHNYWMIHVNVGSSGMNIVCHDYDLVMRFMKKFGINEEEIYTCSR